ncbi:N2227-domain-containing protein [Tilletiopsis washingtonensis]|uniref:carnosine N-methyltransferase n=1 Tax=Tilletiopsis washingtonensis TaxID=58919 RepID=A0A316Z7L5_9BASI|nr:N2227-domain-containing protein [Tilletiopsis washingtonensis]PWN97760.1 N2227-domain-containing protein [Tilletiopsis washingtonensis]
MQAAPHSHSHASSSALPAPERELSDAEKERLHFQSVLQAFDAYLPHSLETNNARRRSYYALPRAHRTLLSQLGPTIPGPMAAAASDEEGHSTGIAEQTAPSEMAPGGIGFKARLAEIDDRIRRNADVLSLIVDDSRGFFGEAGGVESEAERDSSGSGSDGANASASEKGKRAHDGQEQSAGRQGAAQHQHGTDPRRRRRVADQDLDKIRSTIKQLVRDWSDEGNAEREAAYGPVLDALDARFGTIAAADRPAVRVLVPGAGLGRLAFEVAWQGYSCQGNEYSFFMLLASHWILNKSARRHEHTIYPYVHSSSNWRSAQDLLQGVRIPDVNPSDLPPHVDFSMVAGEFVDVYSKAQEGAAWDAVATVYFVDTARNVVRYLEVLNHVLPVGGIWINAGPLLWHYENNGDLSIELTLEEMLGLVEQMGFELLKHRALPPQPYTGNAACMLSYQYTPAFWVARKVRDVTPAPSI